MKNKLQKLIAQFLALGLVFSASAFRVGAEDPLLSEFQSVPTAGAYSWEQFSIDGEDYLAVANNRDSSSNWVTDSEIYKWNGTEFAEFQTVATQGAEDWEYFTIGTDHYLALANNRNNSTHSVTSPIYKWSGTGFDVFQNISTVGNSDWEFFTIGTDYYLASANSNDDSRFNMNSEIYKWDGDSFEPYQSIATMGASNWTSFEIGTDSYLFVSNHFGDSTNYNTDSKLYKWDGSQFVEEQSIAGFGSYNSDFYEIGGEYYLAMPNMRNAAGDYTVSSEIYKWSGTGFTAEQSLATTGAWDAQHFVLGGEHYLATSSFYNGSTYDLSSKIYKWDGSQMVEEETFATKGGHSLTPFTLSTGTYLALANHYDGTSYAINSMIYKVDNGSTETSTQAEVHILSGAVTISAPALIQFGEIGVSSSAQEIEIDLADPDYFALEDLKADPAGYYTTLSVSDLTDGAKTIAADNMEIKVESGTVATLAGSANPQVTVPSALESYLQFTSASPVTLLQRDADPAGLVGRYGVLPSLRLSIPAYQSLGSYTAVVTYTLIEG